MVTEASVVIPTFNKASFLRLTLTSLTTQLYRDFEVIVVDDGSVDDTQNVVQELSPSLPNLKYIKQSNQGRSRARNRAIEAADGSVIIFTEDDYLMRPDFVSQHMSCHDGGTLSAVVGGIGYRTVTHLPPHGILADAEYQALLSDADFAARLTTLDAAQLESWPVIITPEDVLTRFVWIESMAIPLGLAGQLDWVEQQFGRHFQGFHLPWLFFGGGNVSVSRAALAQTGGFEESFVGWGSEDLELGYRLHRSNVAFVINRNTQSLHQIHFRPTRDISVQARDNHAKFCQLHPDYAVLLFYLYNTRQYAGILEQPITLSEYNSRVGAYVDSSAHQQAQLMLDLRRVLGENGVSQNSPAGS
jgi:glycosyltransferase involved in cell wall biosynthesis